MPSLKTHNLFISHVWRDSENSEYYRLEEMLNNEMEASNFRWKNYSVPNHDPLETKTRFELSKKLNDQIKPIHCFLVISGMYVNHRKWIQEEIKIANSYNKPIIGIIPRGQERIPDEVDFIAHEMVRWNTDSIISAIKKYSL